MEESEKILLRRLSFFAGGMDLEAVEAVCAGDGLDAYDLLDILSGLVNKSLVISQRQQDQRPRYTLLETIRQYAQEQLVETGYGGKYRDRHLKYFQQLAFKAGAHFCAVTYGMTKRREWEVAGVQRVIDTLSELPKLLQAINRSSED